MDHAILWAGARRGWKRLRLDLVHRYWRAPLLIASRPQFPRAGISRSSVAYSCTMNMGQPSRDFNSLRNRSSSYGDNLALNDNLCARKNGGWSICEKEFAP